MDEIDQAQHCDELYRQSALSRHFAGCHPVPPVKRRETTCVDCGDEIETARLEALPNAVRCCDCQNKKERRDKHGFV